MTTSDGWWVATIAFLPVLYYLCYHHLYLNHPRHLRGLTVLITGCDTGLGRDLALRLSSLGMVVYAGCLTPDAVSSLTQLAHPTLHPLLLDVTSSSSVRTAVSRLTPFLLPHGLDCVVNNAGVFESFLTELTPLSCYERSLAVNFLGAVRVTKAFLPLVRRARGRVLSVSSFLGFTSGWSLSAYAASKHALEAWHDALRVELRGFGVQCSLVQPGTMRTALLAEVGHSYTRLWKAGGGEVKRAYGEAVMDVVPRIDRIMAALSTSTDGVLRVIELSLRSRHSCSRYLVGWDAWGLWLTRFLPVSDHTMDRILSWVVAIPEPPVPEPASDAESD